MRRCSEVLQFAVQEITEDAARRLVKVWHAATLQVALLASDVAQELLLSSEISDAIVSQELVLLYAIEEGLDRAHGVCDVLDLDGLPENEAVGLVLG